MSTIPGSIIVTRTLCSSASLRSAQPRPTTPHFVAMYTGSPTQVCRPAIEAINTMWPRPRSFIRGNTARTVWSTPRKFVSTTRRHRSGSPVSSAL